MNATTVTAAQIKHIFANSPYSFMFTIASHLSPVGEASIAKGIPMHKIWDVRQYNKVLPIRVKYRGPRRPGVVGKSTCLKADATSFAIYPR